MAPAVPLRSEVIAASGGVRLRADVGGPAAGVPVILMHGGGQTRHSWGQAAQNLALSGCHVTSLDLRGHGDSDWAPQGDYSIDAFVDDLRCVAARLDRLPVLVGASLGGATALLAVGEAIAPMAAGLVLVDVVPRMAPEGIGHIHAFMNGNPEGFTSLQEAADAVARYLPRRRRPPSPEGLMKNLRRQANGRLHWHWDPAFMSSPQRIEPEAVVPRMEAAARQVGAPTLLVRGRQSEVVDEEGTQRLLELIPHAQVVGVEGAGHMVAGDRNDQFNDAVEAFVQRLRA